MLAFSLSDRFLDCTILSQCVTSVVRVPVKITISEVQGNRSNQRHSTSFHALADKSTDLGTKKKTNHPSLFPSADKYRNDIQIQIRYICPDCTEY
jgi:hypothetical protein